MVTSKDHKYNYLLLRFLCFIYHLPFQFDAKNVKMLLDTSKWKQRMWYILYLNSVVCVAYQVLSLLRVLVGHEGDLNFHHLSTHVVFALADPMMIFSAYNLFIRHPELTAEIFNDVAGFVDGQRENTQRAKYIRTMASGQVTIEIAMIALFIIMPESPQFYYSRLPPMYQNDVGFVFMLMYECGTNVGILTPFFIMLFIQICFFNTMTSRLRQWNTDLRNVELPTSERIRKGCKRCRQAQRDVARFNQVFADVIVALKQVLITVSIAGFSFCIKHYADHPLLSALSTFYGLQGVVMYITFYDDGYQIQARMEEMKRLIKIAANSNASLSDMKSVNALLRSIPRVGVQVGRFYYLKRASTLIFCDFVVGQVVALAVGMGTV